MANFEEMTTLIAINNVREYEHLIPERYMRKKKFISDPFMLSNRLFIKNLPTNKRSCSIFNRISKALY